MLPNNCGTLSCTKYHTTTFYLTQRLKNAHRTHFGRYIFFTFGKKKIGSIPVRFFCACPLVHVSPSLFAENVSTDFSVPLFDRITLRSNEPLKDDKIMSVGINYRNFFLKMIDRRTECSAVDVYDFEDTIQYSNPQSYILLY